MNTRHPQLEATCTLLSEIMLGREAQALLASELPDYAGLLVAPIWTWRTSRIDVGAKDRDPSGQGRYLLPVAITWPAGHLYLVTDDQVLAHTVSGMGHSSQGQTAVRIGISETEATVCVGSDIPSELLAPGMRRRQLTAALTQMSEAGALAGWKLREKLGVMAGAALITANKAVAAEVFDHHGTAGIVDQLTIDDLATHMTLGYPAGTEMVGPTGRTRTIAEMETSAIDKLIERCIQPATHFARVDPLLYIRRDLRRTAESMIRLHIGDPRIGRKVRALQRQQSFTDIDSLLDAYTAAHPGDGLSERRARAALLAALLPQRGAYSLDQLTESSSGAGDRIELEDLVRP